MTSFLKIKGGQEFLGYLRGLDRKSQVRLGLALGGGGLLFVFILWPAWVVRPEVQNQVQALRNTVTSAETQIRREPEFVAEKKQLEAFVQKVHSQLLTEEDTQRLIGILTEMSERTKTSLLASQPQAEVQPIPAPFNQRYAMLTYLLAVEGNYHALATFISEIENYPKMLRVDEFSVMSREEKPGVLVGEIRLSGFFKREGG